jgi:hypothetical protein
MGKPLSTAGFWTGGLGISDKINSAEDGIDGTNGYFRPNFGAVPWNRKLSEFRSEPFVLCGRENNSELRSMEQK